MVAVTRALQPVVPMEPGFHITNSDWFLESKIPNAAIEVRLLDGFIFRDNSDMEAEAQTKTSASIIKLTHSEIGRH